MHLNSTQHRQRLQHLPEEEYTRVRVIAEREQEAQKLVELIAGRDLVQLALTDPSEIIAYQRLKYTLLGRITYDRDKCSMVTRITSDVAKATFTLVRYITNFDETPHDELTNIVRRVRIGNKVKKTQPNGQ